MKSRTVLQAKRLGIVSCSGSDRLEAIAGRMADEDISALVVTDANGYLTGIISRSDLLRAYVESLDWRAASVEEFMTREVVTVSPDTRLSEAAVLLLGRHIHRVVVVRQEAEGKRPIAVLSDSDLVCELATSA
ncbi:MAG TPA: CBS domain-containing protein [Anaerolineae bacterium]|nr:CBS domain-containing protein [Anaerolineae bacterium]HNU05281.1 CBS domain-containing protein [Anaerolineae bacterium]